MIKYLEYNDLITRLEYFKYLTFWQELSKKEKNKLLSIFGEIFDIDNSYYRYPLYSIFFKAIKNRQSLKLPHNLYSLPKTKRKVLLKDIKEYGFSTDIIPI